MEELKKALEEAKKQKEELRTQNEELEQEIISQKKYLEKMEAELLEMSEKSGNLAKANETMKKSIVLNLDRCNEDGLLDSSESVLVSELSKKQNHTRSTIQEQEEKIK